MVSTKKYEVLIHWGEADMHLDRAPGIYRFTTAAERDAFMAGVELAINYRKSCSAELDAFLKGVDEAEGYLDFATIPHDGVCPTCGADLPTALFSSNPSGNA